ncbi:TetR/AcrR family transcriptional regulator [Lacticaseibacillus kribbianus]|uniref:TetR/AcrR family transcriptional regulator n=1 Tax=Lacticaseibacillus kribbianus TaxID=2926292 RepID=UPI001CD78E65|nr:TetR/AcrR family transcriptional regulator [Lacticaseibacillus kribbianus]
MPKPTFFRLADEKRMRLIKAAYAEFARAPFADASISNIIKDAGIPRGSFYQYFDDKADVFFYLLERMRQNTEQMMRQTVIDQHGDFFAAMAEMFDRLIDTIVQGPHADFYANVFMYMDFHSVSKLSPGPKKPPHGQLTQFLVENIDRTPLRVDSDDDLRMLIRQVMGLFMQTIGHYYNHRAAGEVLPIGEVKSRLAQLLNWIQYGVVAPKEATNV